MLEIEHQRAPADKLSFEAIGRLVESASRSRGDERFDQAGSMNEPTSFNRLILRAVLRQVSTMVIRLLSVSDQMELPEFRRVIRIVPGWKIDFGYIVRVRGQEFNSFRRKTRAKALHELKLHRQEKFLYICNTLHMWEGANGTRPK